MRLGKMVFIGLIVAVALTAFAVGAGKNSSKTVVLCAAKKGGDLTLADKGKCGKGEKKVSIAKQGPAGPVGPQGAVGPAGSAPPLAAARLVAPATTACAVNTGAFCVTESGVCYNMGNAGGGTVPVSFRKDSDGFVHLEGAFTNFNPEGACGGTGLAPVFYLPSGFKPAAGTQRFIVAPCAGDGSGLITVAPTGLVQMKWVNGWCLDLSGIVFHADA